MNLELYNAPETLYVRIIGRFVLDDCEGFRNAVFPIDSNTIKHVAVDLEKTEFIDSAGLSALVGLKVKANKQGFRLSLVNPSPATEEILRISKLSQIFDIMTGVDAKGVMADAMQPQYRIYDKNETKSEADLEERHKRIEEENRKASDAVEQKDYDRAINHYLNVLALSPDSLEANANLAKAYEAKPMWANKALAQWTRLQDLARRQNARDYFERAQKHIIALRKL